MLDGGGGIDMMGQVRYTALLFLLLVSTAGQGAPPDEEQLINQAVEDLNGATRWIIEEGIRFYSEHGDNVRPDPITRVYSSRNQFQMGINYVPRHS